MTSSTWRLSALLDVVLKLLEESVDRDEEKMHHAVGLIAEHLHRSIDPLYEEH